jgi:hypothetical protein
MANIKQKFTYPLPDEYLAQTTDLGLIGEWEYEGPEKVYAFIDKDGKIIISWGYRNHDDSLTQEENDKNMDIVSGLDAYYAPIEFSKDPILLSALVQIRMSSDQPQKEYRLTPDGEVFYSRPDPTLPNHTIEVADCEWDFEANDWKRPFPWKTPHITREVFESAFNRILSSMGEVDASPFTSAQKKKWSDFIKEFENVPTKFADYMDTPWMVPFPTDPRYDDAWTAEKGGLIPETEILPPTVPFESPGEEPLTVAYDFGTPEEGSETEEEKAKIKTVEDANGIQFWDSKQGFYSPVGVATT